MIYSTIIFSVKKRLGLTLEEYLFLDAVYHLQAKTGASYAKNDYYMELLDLKLRQVQSIKSGLKEKGLLTGDGIAIKTTDKWDSTYLDTTMQKNAPQGCSKVHGKGAEKCTPTIDKEIDKEKDNKGDKSPSKFNPLGAEIIKALEVVDPRNKLYYGNKTQRAACDFLITEYGFEEVKGAINFYALARGKVKYLPSISTPCELRDKWNKLQGLLERKSAENMEAQNNVVFAGK